MPETTATPIAGKSSLQASLGAAALFCLALLLVYYQTVWSMVSIWLRSDTFAHGFLILPISLWLVWVQRDRLRLIDPRPVLWVALLIIPTGFVWLLAWLVDVLVIQQLSLVAMLVIGAWALMGHQLARVLAFPLLFLFFAVPMGEALIPPMMEFTATSTVWLIRLTGIPVYREGLYFTLPSGSWSVVEACSGVRYIIASVTLGVLYAYLTYRSLWRRALFVLVSAIVPIFANTVRAYIIVMLGHASDMKVATGVDHLIYGWVFFGLVIFLLFWLGSFFRQDQPALPGDDRSRLEAAGEAGLQPSKLLASMVVVLAIAGIWPLLASSTATGSAGASQAGFELPEASGAWRAALEPEWQWRPDAAVARQEVAYYTLDGHHFGLFVQYSDGSLESGEVVGSSARFTAKDSAMRVVGRDKISLRLGDKAVLVDQAQLLGVDGQLIAWSWYRIGNQYTSNNYVAKFHEAWSSLGIGSPGTYRIVVAVPMQGEITAGPAHLQDFLDAHGSRLDQVLEKAAQGPK